MLLKQVAKVKKGSQPNEFFSYLGEAEKLFKTPSGASSVADVLDMDHLERALATRAAYVAF